MHKISLLLLFSLSTLVTKAQEIKKDLKPFERIVASPRINVILTKGEKESIRLTYNGVKAEKINIEVHHKTLHVYLDDAKKVEKTKRKEWNSRSSIYEGATLTAYVTYKDLSYLEIRGNQELTCSGAIESDDFRLKAYGENDITLASLKTDFFKASLYGRNDLKINNGKVIEQRYRLYGENKIDTRPMRSAFASAAIFGEGKVKLHTSEEIRINAFGEPDIQVDGGGEINRRLVMGRVSIHND